MDTCKVKDSLALSDACDLVSYHVVSRYLKLKSYPQIFSNKRKRDALGIVARGKGQGGGWRQHKAQLRAQTSKEVFGLHKCMGMVTLHSQGCTANGWETVFFIMALLAVGRFMFKGCSCCCCCCYFVAFHQNTKLLVRQRSASPVKFQNGTLQGTPVGGA